MSRVYLIRHGKPASTWSQGFDADPGLDETGRAQAEAARDALLAIPEPNRPRRVISSPLRRCRETALPFAQALGVELEIDPVFGEVPTPSAVPQDERAAWLKTAFGGRWDQIVGDLDYLRWRSEIARALALREGCAVFSHYVAINAAVSFVTKNPMVLAFRPDHASITTFDVDGGAAVLAELGREAVTGVL
jgi:broad specificity phosphatase PhoE